MEWNISTLDRCTEETLHHDLYPRTNIDLVWSLSKDHGVETGAAKNSQSQKLSCSLPGPQHSQSFNAKHTT